MNNSGNLATDILAILALITFTGGIVGLWIDFRITSKLAPVKADVADIKNTVTTNTDILTNLDSERHTNGGVHVNPTTGKLDGTSKDMQTLQVKLLHELIAETKRLKERNE